MPYKATGHQASLQCYELAILLPNYTCAHTRTHTQARAHRASWSTTYFIQNFQSPVPIFKIYCKIKKTETLMFFKLFFYSNVNVI